MSTARIFIVEDQGIVALDLQSRLVDMGYEVPYHASSGEEALARIAEINPDLILMDIKLKGEMDGIEASRQIQERQDVPVIFLTALSDQDTLSKAKLTAPFGYIIKPFDDQQLFTTIEMALYRHQVDRALHENQQWLSTTMNSIGDAVITYDTQGLVTSMNLVAQSVTGWTQGQAIGQPIAQIFKIVGRQTHRPIEIPTSDVLSDGKTINLTEDNNLITKDGREIPIDDSLAPIKDSKGVILGGVLVFRDITVRRKAEEALRTSENRFRNIILQSPIGIALFDLNGGLIEANPVILNFFGVSGFSDLEGLNLFDDRTLSEELKRKIRAGDTVRYQTHIDYNQLSQSSLYRQKTGILYLDYLLTPWIGMAESQEGYLLQVQDITDRKLAEERILFDARHDSLTGLPNRTYFLDQLKRTLEQINRRKEDCAAVLFIDLDRFKIINDSLGHAAGDQLLKIISKRLKNSLRPGDFIARIGGDEFAILLHDIMGIGDSIHVAERVLSVVSAPTKLMGQEVYTTISIGIALATSESKNPEDLLRNADIAMYRAKYMGKARFAIFDQEMYARNLALMELEAELRSAIEREELRLYYRPILSTASGLIAGTEAELGWRNSRRGWISPAEFMPIAIETGLIFQIGKWLLRGACAQAASWQKLTQAPLRVKINLTTQQLQVLELKNFIHRILTSSGLQPGYLEIGVRQDAAECNPELTLKAMRELKSMGIRISMNNLRQAYWIINHLELAPTDTIVIDKAFTSRYPGHEQYAALIASMISMGRALGLNVLAEGVDTKEQMDFLLPLCDEIQGEMVGAALPAEDLAGLLYNT